MLMKNYYDLNIDLNARINDGKTGFHLTCWNDHTEVAKLLMKNSVEFDINLNAIDDFGMSAFHLSCWFGKMLLSNTKCFNIDVESRTKLGKTGFELAKQDVKYSDFPRKC